MPHYRLEIIKDNFFFKETEKRKKEKKAIS